MSGTARGFDAARRDFPVLYGAVRCHKEIDGACGQLVATTEDEAAAEALV